MTAKQLGMNRETTSLIVTEVLNMHEVSSSMMLNRSWHQADSDEEINLFKPFTKIVGKPQHFGNNSTM
jgi:hypothetical protein